MLGSIFHLHSKNRTFGKQTVSVSEDPDQMPHFAASDLGLYSLPMSHKKDARLIWVNVFLGRPRGVCAPLLQKPVDLDPHCFQCNM